MPARHNYFVHISHLKASLLAIFFYCIKTFIYMINKIGKICDRRYGEKWVYGYVHEQKKNTRHR